MLNRANSLCVDVSGIDSCQITDLPIVIVGDGVPSRCGDIIASMCQCTHMGNV